MLTADQNIQTAEPSNIVIFGAAGDLTKRKLMPALARMFCCGLIHANSRIIGVLRNRSEEEWLGLLREGLHKHSPEFAMDEDRWQKFSSRLKIVDGDLDDDELYQRLAESMETIDAMARIGNPNSVSDAAVGAICARSAVLAANLNVQINAVGLGDTDAAQRYLTEGNAIEGQAIAKEHEILQIARAKISP